MLIPWQCLCKKISLLSLVLSRSQAVLLFLPALCPIDYALPANIILTVNILHIVVSFYLCQCNLNNPYIYYYAWFGFITLNNCKLWSSQPKLKLYGFFYNLHTLKMYLIRACNFVIEGNGNKPRSQTQISNPEQALIIELSPSSPSTSHLLMFLALCIALMV